MHTAHFSTFRTRVSRVFRAPVRALALSALVSCGLLGAPGAHAVTAAPAGTVIGNQASATY